MSKFPYEDILYKERPVSTKHGGMSRENRAAQFSPFAALTGFGEAVDETARLTEYEVTLEEDRKEELDKVMRELLQKEDNPRITVTFFVPDKQKEGGAYYEKSGQFRRVIRDTKVLQFMDGTEIELENIMSVKVDKP